MPEMSFTLENILEAYAKHDQDANRNVEPVLWFLSELTGLSVDRLLELM